MVVLSRIYTKGGDSGQTSLGDGSGVPKQTAGGGLRHGRRGQCHHRPRPAAYRRARPMRCWRASRTTCSTSAPISAGPATTSTTAALRISDSQVERLEREIDAMNGELQPLDSFVLPGGTPAAAYLHLARTVVRRAERLVVELARGGGGQSGGDPLPQPPVRPLFVLSRALNDDGAGDVLWVPGANR